MAVAERAVVLAVVEADGVAAGADDTGCGEVVGGADPVQADRARAAATARGAARPRAVIRPPPLPRSSLSRGTDAVNAPAGAALPRVDAAASGHEGR
jgi:hypothetical protein